MNILEKFIKRNKLRNSNGIELLCSISNNKEEALKYCVNGDYVYIESERRIFVVIIVNKQKTLIPLS